MQGGQLDDQLAMQLGSHVRHDEQTDIRISRESLYADFDFSGPTNGEGGGYDAERWCSCFNCIGEKTPRPGAVSGLNNSPTRLTPGAISLSSSSHFVPMAGSYIANPVILLPGRARLFTNPAPTGSVTWTNTIGMLLVAPLSARVEGVDWPKITSGASCTSSFASL